VTRSLFTASAERIGKRVRERRVLEPAIPTHDRHVSHDLSRT
jgi:hypothetical protein